MASKDKGGKGKRKNNGPAEQRYKAEMRWERNKARARKRNANIVMRHVVKHDRRGTLGYRDRQLARNAAYAATA